MLSFQTVVPHTLELLTELMDVPLFSEMRLVGGTALALQYGHRQSVDLDFFGKLSADVSEIHDVLANIGSHTIYTNTQNIKIFEVNVPIANNGIHHGFCVVKVNRLCCHCAY